VADTGEVVHDIGEDNIPAKRGGNISFHNRSKTKPCAITGCDALVGPFPIRFSPGQTQSVRVTSNAKFGPHEYEHTCPTAHPVVGNPRIIVGS